ncbi:MAG: TM0106 family RecB-like putative nuclease, partial [Mycobacteriaceae bacterium]
FWTWLMAARAEAAEQGRTFAAYCYSEAAENRWLLASARRFAGMAGIPTTEQVQEFIDSEQWVDVYAAVGAAFLCPLGKGLKKVAPVAGFSWRDPEAGGEASMGWYRVAVGMDGGVPDMVQRQRLLDYNADDVWATKMLREWMDSPAVREVPLASEL